MISGTERFRINTPGVVSDTIEGETIGINLDTGHYYSLPGVANQIWLMIGQRSSVAAIVDQLCAAYSGAQRKEIEGAVCRFLKELLAEGLVVVDDEPTPEQKAAPDFRLPTSAFEPPRFERYTDMREFLLVDPIHDVDVTQWPRPGENQKKS